MPPMGMLYNSPSMKTFILQLESHDDRLTICDKINWIKARRVLLILPPRGSALTNRLDLVLIQRACQRMGAQLGLVTDRPSVKEHARDLGIPVFTSREDAQTRPWRRTRRRRSSSLTSKRPSLPELRAAVRNLRPASPALIVRFFTFLIGILAVVVIILFFIPTASIRMKLPDQTQSLSLQILASPEVVSPGISGQVPIRTSSVIVEGEDQIACSDFTSLPGNTANGLVRLTNLTDAPVPVPTGSIVSTLGDRPVRFETQKTIEVPAGIGQAVDVPIRSLVAGSQANVPTNTIVAVEGRIGLSVSANNIEPTSGGSDQIVPAAAPQDYLALKARMRDQLKQDAMAQIQQVNATQTYVLADTIQEGQVISETRSLADGQPGNFLTLKMRVEYTGWTIRLEDVESAAVQALNVASSPGQVEVPGSLKVEWITQPQRVDGGARWEVFALRRMQKALVPTEIRQMAAGKNINLLQQQLATVYGLASPADIRLHPDWWPRMPFLAFQIQVDVQ